MYPKVDFKKLYYGQITLKIHTLTRVVLVTKVTVP